MLGRTLAEEGDVAAYRDLLQMEETGMLPLDTGEEDDNT
jgi:hypothetical protein